MYVSHWEVDVVEQFIVILHRVARREEHHDFLVSILLKEGEQHKKTLLRRNHNVPLCCEEYGLLKI